MSDDFAAVVRRAKERDQLADETYRALRSTGRLSKQRALAYRCPRRCLLLDVVPTPQGLLLHVPRYKLSPQLNAELTSGSGRAKNTEDGDRRWLGQSFFEEAAVNCSLTCDHTRGVIELAEIHEDLRAGVTEVRWPR